jgi:hypothetical protein
LGRESVAFERTYRGYLERIAGLDLASRAARLGIGIEGGEARIPLFGRPHAVSASGVRDPSGARPIHSVSVVLCQYLLLGPDVAPAGGADWVSFRDFRDAAPFVEGFVNNSERAISRRFAGRRGDLVVASDALCGTDPGLDVSYEVRRRFEALPMVPVVMLFNDEDEEFGADCTILFERRAGRYLDMECLAILGWLLADRLDEAAGGPGRTIM